MFPFKCPSLWLDKKSFARFPVSNFNDEISLCLLIVENPKYCNNFFVIKMLGRKCWENY